jgi:hypothetical protein
LGDQYAFGVARQLQITIGGEVVILMCLHSIFLSFFFVSFRFSVQHNKLDYLSHLQVRDF